MKIPRKNSETCSKLQVPNIKYGYQIKKKVPFPSSSRGRGCSISKINVAYSNTNPFSLYYKLRHIHNPWYIQNPEILKKSTVFRSLSDILQCLRKIVPAIIIISGR